MPYTYHSLRRQFWNSMLPAHKLLSGQIYIHFDVKMPNRTWKKKKEDLPACFPSDSPDFCLCRQSNVNETSNNFRTNLRCAADSGNFQFPTDKSLFFWRSKIKWMSIDLRPSVRHDLTFDKEYSLNADDIVSILRILTVSNGGRPQLHPIGWKDVPRTCSQESKNFVSLSVRSTQEIHDHSCRYWWIPTARSFQVIT